MIGLNKKNNGYIAMISIIIIGAVVLGLVVAMTNVSLSQKMSLISQNLSAKSYYLANACAHIAVVNLQKDENYAGNEVQDIDGEICNIEPVTGTGNENREITTSSTNGNHTKKIKVTIDQLRPTTEISYWGELIE